jgi:hypothetical protein
MSNLQRDASNARQPQNVHRVHVLKLCDAVIPQGLGHELNQVFAGNAQHIAIVANLDGALKHGPIVKKNSPSDRGCVHGHQYTGVVP